MSPRRECWCMAWRPWVPSVNLVGIEVEIVE
jgi:hypothetical protein